MSAEDEIRPEDANGRGPTKVGVKHSSGEMNGSGSNGHAGPHENLPPRPDEKLNLILEVAEKVLDAEVIAETLEVAAKTVSVVGEIDSSMATEDDALVEQDLALRTVVFWVRNRFDAICLLSISF